MVAQAPQLVDNYLPIPGSDHNNPRGGIDFARDGLNWALNSGTMEFGMKQPFIDKHGRTCVVINQGRTTVEKGERRYVREKVFCTDYFLRTGKYEPVWNAAVLRKDDWIQLQMEVVTAYRKRLRATADLGASARISGFNAWATSIYEHETMSDPGVAVEDMDGLTDGGIDRPKFQLEGVPLYVTHSDFWYSDRVMAISRNRGSTGLSGISAEAAGRRIGERIEKVTIGVDTGFSYGVSTDYSRTSQAYGYLTFPSRNTLTTLTTPTGSNPWETLEDVLDMRQGLYDDNRYGPYVLYHSDDWDTYLDGDYYDLTTSGAVAPTQTLRQRILQIPDIQAVRRLDYLDSTSNPLTLILAQMDRDTGALVDGMPPRVLQWGSMGDLRLNFKVMSIQVPLLVADNDGRCGIMIGTTS